MSRPANFRQLPLNFAGAEIGGIRQKLAELGENFRNVAELGENWRKLAEFGGIRRNSAEIAELSVAPRLYSEI